MTGDSREIVAEVRQLSYCYPSGLQALHNVGFSVRQGERIGLVGPSGAGKSTLLKHLNGLLPERFERGESNGASPVHVCGLPVTPENLADVRRLVGFVFQDPDDQLFCPTVVEDVAFGPLNLRLPRDEIERRIGRSLEAVGLSGFEPRSTAQLSVGERKRVCLAGVLACEPALLVLDEPFGSLDPRSRRALMNILENFDGSLIIATHDLDLLVDLCERVLVLDEGGLHADGPAETVLAEERLMEEHGLEVPLRIRFGERTRESQ